MLGDRDHCILNVVYRRSEQMLGDRRRLFARMAVIFLLLVSVWPAAYAHPDLELQIEELTAQLEHQPENVELLLKRGDLQRRHENRDMARADFNRVREIEPENKTIDWFEGRLEVESGRPEEGVQYLDRFLRNHPAHTTALQNRAQGYLLLNQPLLAATDFAAVIQLSAKPSPSLFSDHALALIAAGAEYFPAAMNVVQSGLKRFPAEITLTGIGVDLSLAQSDTKIAGGLINQLPVPIQDLSQWQTRKALLDCQTGHEALAALWFSNSAGVDEVSSRFRHAPPMLTKKHLLQLAAEPSSTNCQAAALQRLQAH